MCETFGEIGSRTGIAQASSRGARTVLHASQSRNAQDHITAEGRKTCLIDDFYWPAATAMASIALPPSFRRLLLEFSHYTTMCPTSANQCQSMSQEECSPGDVDSLGYDVQSSPLKNSACEEEDASCGGSLNYIVRMQTAGAGYWLLALPRPLFWLAPPPIVVINPVIRKRADCRRHTTVPNLVDWVCQLVQVSCRRWQDPDRRVRFSGRVLSSCGSSWRGRRVAHRQSLRNYMASVCFWQSI